MFNKNDDIEINFDNDLLDSMDFKGVVISSIDKSIGIAGFTEEIEENVVLRLYCLLLDQNLNSYHVTHEISAFSMQSNIEVANFLSELPGMSALEILLLMNPIPYVHTN